MREEREISHREISKERQGGRSRTTSGDEGSGESERALRENERDGVRPLSLRENDRHCPFNSLSLWGPRARVLKNFYRNPLALCY